MQMSEISPKSKKRFKGGDQTRIIVVDDTRFNALLVLHVAANVSVFSPQISVLKESSALSLLKKWLGVSTTFQPTYVLLDLNMTDLSGWVFLDSIQNDPVLQDSNILVFSSSSGQSDTLATFKARSDGGSIENAEMVAPRDVVEIMNNYVRAIKLSS